MLRNAEGMRTIMRLQILHNCMMSKGASKGMWHSGVQNPSDVCMGKATKTYKAYQMHALLFFTIGVQELRNRSLPRRKREEGVRAMHLRDLGVFTS